MATNGENPPPMTRAKEVIHGDEEAGAELKLGEFQNVSSLTLSETKEVLTAVFNHRREQGKFKVPDNEYVFFLSLQTLFLDTERVGRCARR